MSRIDSLDLPTVIKGYRRMLDELKTAQRTGGASLVFKVNQGARNVLFPTSVAAGASASTSVYFLPDHQQYSFSELSFRVFCDGVEVFPGDANFPGRLTVARDRPAPVLPTYDYWLVYLTNGTASAHQYAIEPYVQATDTGVIS